MRSFIFFIAFILLQSPFFAEDYEEKPSDNLLYVLGLKDDSVDGYLVAMEACEYIWKRCKDELKPELFLELSRELEAFSAKMPKTDKEIGDAAKGSLENTLKKLSGEGENESELEGGFPMMTQRLSNLIELIVPFVEEAEKKFEISFEF